MDYEIIKKRSIVILKILQSNTVLAAIHYGKLLQAIEDEIPNFLYFSPGRQPAEWLTLEKKMLELTS
uniref:Uncharacterized protein n=1 Tax=viral metagenome TaxID=1070528 RepID=A0A6M3LK09_9ZZZZ